MPRQYKSGRVPRSPRVPRVCVVCGAAMLVKPCEIAKGGGRFCSRPCFFASGAVRGKVAHGETRGHVLSAEYKAWTGMKGRCLVPFNGGYPRYGALGINVCDRWRDSYEAFLADMGRKPSANHSLDRINNDGHYEPGNVRWATAVQQQGNRHTTRLITLDGVTKPLTEWARATGLSKSCLRGRMAAGWSPERALTAPPEVHRLR